MWQQWGRARDWSKAGLPEDGHTRLRQPDFEYLAGAQCPVRETTRLACYRDGFTAGYKAGRAHVQ